MKANRLLVVAALTLAATALAAGADDAPKKVAVAYLKALSGQGDDSAREYLLGGVTLTAEEFSIPNWKIVERHPPRVETASIKDAIKAMRELDAAGRRSLDMAVNIESDDGLATLTKEQAQKMLEPTTKAAAALKDAYPVFAYVARVGKDVFWHPSNPWRSEVEKIDNAETYTLELHLFRVQEKQADGTSRVWPLRVIRLTAGNYDSGWRVLPASDWNPDY